MKNAVGQTAFLGDNPDNIELGGSDGGRWCPRFNPIPYLISEGRITSGNEKFLIILARLNVDGQGFLLPISIKKD